LSLSGQLVLTSTTEFSQISASTPVATFTDTNLSDTAGDFTASINWGDGLTSAGTVVGSNGSFTVEADGQHLYTDEGTDIVTVTLTHTADQATATASGNVAVGEHDVLSADQGGTFTAFAGHVFSNIIADFREVSGPAIPFDFTASIDWGDGQTTAGTVTASKPSSEGEGFLVSGSHTYAVGGNYTVKVTLAEDAPGTATATSTTTAAVSPFAGPYDFNGDLIADLVFQSFGGGGSTPQIWLWNGTAVTSQMTFPNPGAGWHIITSGDANGDGKADLFWQNSDGTPGIWLMNGTTPIAEAGLPNPGTFWHLVASGDVNRDGRSELIWQGDDGTLGVWLTNGTAATREMGIGNPGANWKVIGTADFNTADINDNGTDDILLQNTTTGNLMIELMSGNNGASISSSVSITVGDPSWHAVGVGEFNGQAEIAWQNNSGTPGIWLMNGTTPTAEVALQNPGAGWQLISIGHFTSDGNADLLWQNTNGAMGLWELNGTNIVAETNLPNPGSGWQSQNGHPIALATG
jgi:hypothetical protein